MAEVLESVPDEEFIFRLADRGSSFLPEDTVLPLPLWFRPTSEDKREAELRGRVPGLSVWQSSRTTVVQARGLANKPAGEAFGLLARQCRELGEAVNLTVDVLKDPLHNEAPQPGWDGHALIEGLARPAKGNKNTYKNLRALIAESCRQHLP